MEERRHESAQALQLMPLSIFRGFVEEIHPHGLWVRGTCTSDTPPTEFMGDLDREKLPEEEFSKARLGSYFVLKVRTDRTGRHRKTTFRIIERSYTKNELKKIRIEARRLTKIFGGHG